MSNETRQPAGVPVGGQFATNPKPEAGVALVDCDRVQDLRDADTLVNAAYDQLADSDLLDSLRADTDAGVESDYPHEEHADAVRGLRRYRDALVQAAAGKPGDRVLAEPLSKYEAFERAGEDGFLTVTVTADLGEMISAGYSNDEYTVDDYLANLAVKGQIPYDPSYKVVGATGDGNVLIAFTTSIGGEMDAQHGEGMFDACKDGTEAAVCIDCEEPYELAEGHDCGGNEVSPSGTCRRCDIADHDVCPGIDGCSCCADSARRA